MNSRRGLAPRWSKIIWLAFWAWHYGNHSMVGVLGRQQEGVLARFSRVKP
jgi:hypothetical protein